MDQWIELRRKIRNQEVPLRQLQRETGIHRQTLRKIRDNSQPPGYQRTNPIKKSKIGPYLDRIKAIIEDDKQVHKKQRHTAKKIWETLQSKGFDDGYTIVKDAVPQVKDYDELNRLLRDCCQSDLNRTLRGKRSLSKKQLVAEDCNSSIALPDDKFDYRKSTSTFASSVSLVRYDTNDYSVPVTGTVSVHKRTSNELKVCAQEWVQKKFLMQKKCALRKSLYPGKWQHELVVNEVRHPKELDFIKKEGVKILYLADIIEQLRSDKTCIKSAAGKDLIELVMLKTKQ